VSCKYVIVALHWWSPVITLGHWICYCCRKVC